MHENLLEITSGPNYNCGYGLQIFMQIHYFYDLFIKSVESN